MGGLKQTTEMGQRENEHGESALNAAGLFHATRTAAAETSTGTARRRPMSPTMNNPGKPSNETKLNPYVCEIEMYER